MDEDDNGKFRLERVKSEMFDGHSTGSMKSCDFLNINRLDEVNMKSSIVIFTQ